jgi:3-methylfumaryl-CoA hydratase
MHKETGKTQTRNCTLDPAQAISLHNTLALDGPAPRAGDPLPPFRHWIYFRDTQPPENLGRDGHPKPGGFIPDTGLPRRMWAGGDLVFHTPLRIGTPAQKTTTLKSITRKTGRTGPLAFITLHHAIHQNGTLCLTEQQHLVYREDYNPDHPAPVPPTAPTDETHRETRAFNTTLLFRYSALTDNGHRIHYDADYARTVEGYAGLVTHGPLLAQMLMDLAQHHLGPLKGFRFRATAPLTVGKPATLCIRDNNLWVRGPKGTLHMTATANP